MVVAFTCFLVLVVVYDHFALGGLYIRVVRRLISQFNNRIDFAFEEAREEVSRASAAADHTPVIAAPTPVEEFEGRLTLKPCAPAPHELCQPAPVRRGDLVRPSHIPNDKFGFSVSGDGCLPPIVFWAPTFFASVQDTPTKGECEELFILVRTRKEGEFTLATKRGGVFYGELRRLPGCHGYYAEMVIGLTAHYTGPVEKC